MRSADTSLVDDRRAVAPLIGFILLFAIGIVAFSGYQAVQVPQQNAETEFQHFQDVQNDMILVSNAISRAGQTDTSQFESVRLGTTYRERILALNPPAAQGTLRTSTAHEITINDGERSVQTRFLQYRNGYNEFTVGSIYYENSVLYIDERDTGGNVVVLQGQNLVTSDGKVRMTALQNEISRSSVGRAGIELYPAEVEAADDVSEFETVDIGIPTRLNASEYWGDELEETGVYGGVDEDEYDDDVHQLNLEDVAVDDLRFNTVGINDAPDEDEDTLRQGVDRDAPGETTPGESTFTTLSAQSREGGNPSPVTGTLALDTGGSVVITVFDGNDEVGSDAVGFTGDEENWTIPLDSPGQRDEPLDVEADIVGGACLEGTIEERGPDGEITLENNDWEAC